MHVGIRNANIGNNSTQYPRRNAGAENTVLPPTQNRFEFCRSRWVQRNHHACLTAIRTEQCSLEPLNRLGMGQRMLASRQLLKQRSARLGTLKILLCLDVIDIIRIDVLRNELRDQLRDPWIVLVWLRWILTELASLPADQDKLIRREIFAESRELTRFREGLRKPILNFVDVALNG